MAEVQYMKILGYSKTRWLALMPAIERILKMFSPLKSYFLSIDGCPRVLRDFFEDDSSEMWLFFMHSQAALFHNTVRRIESDKSTITEVVSEIDDLIFKLRERVSNQFLPLNVRNKLKHLEENGWQKSELFKTSVLKFYQKCIDYLDARVVQFEHVDFLKWVNFRDTLDWQSIQTSFEYISKFTNSHGSADADKQEAELFEEVSYAKKYANEEKIISWNDSNVEVEERWVELFMHLESNNIPFNNLKKIVEFALCLPGTNAVTERIFSVVNKIWTTEKTQLSVETLKAMLQLRFNFDETCEVFGKNVNNVSLLRKVHNAEKYV
ncbi:uncharacterized protein LOC129717880 isoform X1 [Wyeomyia smithii]|uniref:uncharacterized protein LOC129717880 isoform X1 n=1 Tax=Wyeomyia smithii TaxID=174621 RepID=UPI00246808B3|nr:uncharacterized protein LOC129717880 isoform X1 [Wyeomyia smithii]